MDEMWSRRGGRVLDLAFWVGLLALLAGAVLLAVVLVTRGGVDRASAWADVLGAGLAFVGALVTLVTWWLKQRAAARAPARADQVALAAQELQAVVREQWRKEVEVRSLGYPMPVRWRLSDPAVMDHDDHIGSVPLRFAGCSDRIETLTDQFRKLRRRRLVIVGGPGSGKTTLAVQLLLQLVEGWLPGEPVPVLFSLASWDPHTQPRVQDWLAGQLTQTYPDLRAFGAGAAQKLADQGWLLPVLDGLDEIPTERRGEVIDRLNASLHPDTGLILTSRITEYRDTVHAFDVLTAAAVIEPEPLTSDAAARYLEDRLPRHPGESWRAVLTALRDGTAGALAEVVASPLGLWLLRTVHIEDRRDPQLLIDPDHYPDAATIQHHLLDELIPAVICSRPPLLSGPAPLRPQRHHDPDQIRWWLTTLAIELRDAQTRDWRWWQLARHTFTSFELVAGFTLPDLISGLAAGLAVGSVYSLGRLLGLSELLVLVCIMVCGTVAGMGMRAAVHSGEPAHIELRLRGRTRALGSMLMRGLVNGLIGGLWLGLAGGLGWLLLVLFLAVELRQGGLVNALVVGLFGLVIGLVIGLVMGLVSFVASPSTARQARFPAESQRGDRRLTILVTSIVGVVLGLVFGMLGGLEHGLLGLVSGMLFGILGGLVFGLEFGPVTTRVCWPAFVLASLWLGACRRLPFGLMGFLDDAYRLGLLRVVGPVYQFRHAALQDHLAPPRESVAAHPHPSGRDNALRSE